MFTTAGLTRSTTSAKFTGSVPAGPTGGGAATACSNGSGRGGAPAAPEA